MVYFSKKQVTQNLPANIVKSDANNNFSGTNTFTGSVVVPNPTNANQAANKSYVDTAIGGCAKLASSNTFTQTNTFNSQTNFGAKVELISPTTHNGAFLENFDYQGENYTSLKFFKNYSTAMLILEVNANSNTATISSPTTNNGLKINNLATPVNPDNAANKGYVDGLLSKNIETEQIAPFKLGTSTVYMKYINNTITVPNTGGAIVPIPGLPSIGKLISHSLSVDNHYILPWSEGSVNLRLIVENNVLKLKADNGSWVNRITGLVYYTKP